MHREQSFSGRCMSQFRYGKAAQSGDCLFGVISFFHGIAFRILRRTLTSFQTVPGAVFCKKYHVEQVCYGGVYVESREIQKLPLSIQTFQPGTTLFLIKSVASYIESQK